jgi:hypothetical protein
MGQIGIGVCSGTGRDGTGRVVVVAVRRAPAGGGVEVAWRGEVSLVPDGTSGRVAHGAAHLPEAEAEARLAGAHDEARRRAHDALSALAATLTGGPGAAVPVVVPTAADAERADAPLAEVLASHTLIHVAEIALFRDALAEAAQDAGLPVARVVDDDLTAAAAASRGTPAEELADEVRALGKEVGPPWRKAERAAATAAVLALAQDAARR